MGRSEIFNYTGDLTLTPYDQVTAAVPMSISKNRLLIDQQGPNDIRVYHGEVFCPVAMRKTETFNAGNCSVPWKKFLISTQAVSEERRFRFFRNNLSLRWLLLA